MNPLVSRPPYRAPMAVAKLPSGSPGGRGLPLDDSIPGMATFAKPEDDTGTDQTQQERKDESIYRVESPRDIPKKNDSVVVVDQSNSKPSTYGLGKSDGTKTKYPYRDGLPNAHNAAALFVAEAWSLSQVRDGFLSRESRIAVTTDGITQGLSPKVQQDSLACQVTLKRSDVKNLRWLFSVNCGSTPRLVRVGVVRKGNAVQFVKLDLLLACSCPAWRWSGAEFHSTTKGYQDTKTPLQGTASTPDIRDPDRINKVCKHVAAVLSFTKSWSIPRK